MIYVIIWTLWSWVDINWFTFKKSRNGHVKSLSPAPLECTLSASAAYPPVFMVIKSESKLITYYKGRHKKCYNHRIADWNDKTSGNWNRGYTWEEECIFIFVPKMSFKLNFLSNFENIYDIVVWSCCQLLLNIVFLAGGEGGGLNNSFHFSFFFPCTHSFVSWDSNRQSWQTLMTKVSPLWIFSTSITYKSKVKRDNKIRFCVQYIS